MRRSSKACAIAERSRRNIAPAGTMTGCPRASSIAANALFASDFDHARLETELARRLGSRIALLARGGVENDAERGRARKGLAHDLDPFGSELDLANEKAGDV